MDSTQATTSDLERSRHHLLTLANKLLARGFHAKLVTPIVEAPFVRVTSVASSQLREDVSLGEVEGELSYCWSWHDQIAPVRHVEAAAERVAYVLTPQGERSR